MGRFEELGTALDFLFRKILNRNFNKADELIQKTEQELNAHKSSTKAHDAGSIAYRGAVVGAENTKQAIDNLKDEVNTIVASAGDGTKDTEIILARGNEPTLGDRLDTTDAQLADTRNRTHITPDDFEGSDIEKIQQVFDYAIDNEIEIIELTRAYDLTGGSIMYAADSYFPFEHMVFQGGIIIKNDPGYVFDCAAENYHRNAPRFERTIFKSGDSCYLFNGNKIIRQNVMSCTFYRMGLVQTNSFLQSVRITNCETGHLGCDFVSAKMAYDFECLSHKAESSTTGYYLINIQTDKTNDVSYYGLRLVNILAEGYTRNAPIILGSGYGLDISGGYFEANKTSIKIDKGVGVSRLAGSINGCVFYGTLSDYDIEIDGLGPNVPLLDLRNLTSNVPVGRYLTNLTNLYREYENLNLYSGGGIAPAASFKYGKQKSYPYTQINNGAGGIAFEIPLQLNNHGTIANQVNKQFLVNITFTIGSSSQYSAHLTGILTIDGYYDTATSSVVYGLNFDKLSERNTGGNINGNLENAANYNYLFKETNTKMIGAGVTKATIIFRFPNGVYANTGNSNRLSIKPINDMTCETFLNI